MLLALRAALQPVAAVELLRVLRERCGALRSVLPRQAPQLGASVGATWQQRVFLGGRRRLHGGYREAELCGSSRAPYACGSKSSSRSGAHASDQSSMSTAICGGAARRY